MTKMAECTTLLGMMGNLHPGEGVHAVFMYSGISE